MISVGTTWQTVCHNGMNNIGNTNNDISVTERSDGCNDDNRFIKRDMNYYYLL